MTTDPALLAEKIRAIDEMTSALKDDSGPTAGPNYNVAPTTTVSTVVKRHTKPEDESTRRIRPMRWGLVPPWARTTAEGGPETKGPLLINARSEKLTTSPVFRDSAKDKRCLVPMDGWYEWQRTGEGKGQKTPYFMYAGDGEPLFMAGLWSTWRPRGESGALPLLSCAIVTTDAAGPLAEIHDRMPLTVSESDWDRWLDPDAPIDERLLRGHGDLDRVQIREVSRLVNSVRNNGPELIEPVQPESRQGTLL